MGVCPRSASVGIDSAPEYQHVHRLILDYRKNHRLVFVELSRRPTPAYVLSSAFSRNHAMRHYLRSLVRPRGSAVYYLIALLLPPFVDWSASLISGFLGQRAYYFPPPMTGRHAIWVITITFLYQFFFGNTLGKKLVGVALPFQGYKRGIVRWSLALSLHCCGSLGTCP